MNVKFSLVVVLILMILISAEIFGQTDSEQKSQADRLPPPSEPIGSGLLLRYLDDALDKAYFGKSNLIVIVKTKDIKNTGLARSRTKNIRNYIRFRGFTNFEVAADLNSKEVEQVELYVSGERLYSLPIKRKNKLSYP